MLPRVSQLLRRNRRQAQLQYYSAGAAEYHRKVTGYPFKLPPAEALDAVYAAIRDNPHKFDSKGDKALGDVKLKRFEPYYIPTWSLDADIRGVVSVKGSSRDAQLFVKGGTLPGHDHAHLAKMYFRSPAFPAIAEVDPGLTPANVLPHTLSWTGDEIQFLPYSVSPFILPPLLRQIPERFTTLYEGIKFRSSSIRFHIFSAVPILYPVYMLATQSGASSVKTTWIVSARSPGASLDIAALMTPYRRLEVLSSSAGLGRAEFMLDFSTENVPDELIDQDSMEKVALMQGVTGLNRTIEQLVKEWLEHDVQWDTVIQGNVPALTSAVWNDPRIKTYDHRKQVSTREDVFVNSRIIRQGERLLANLRAQRSPDVSVPVLSQKLHMFKLPFVPWGFHFMGSPKTARRTVAKGIAISNAEKGLKARREVLTKARAALGLQEEDVLRLEREKSSRAAKKGK